MTFDEFRQLKAYARYDGIYLSVIWIAAFASLIGCTQYQPLSMVCLLLMLSTPLFVAYRLRLFRQDALDGHISFGRALLYCLRVFFNAAFMLALAQWAYMRFIDNGRLATLLRTLTETEETKTVFRQMSIDSNTFIAAFEQVTPLEFASSYFFENVLIGIVLSIIIAMAMRKKT